MKYKIISVGKSPVSNVQMILDEYEKRLNRWTKVEWIYLAHTTKELESKAILKLLKPTDFVVLLDERGEQLDNETLVRKIDIWLANGRQFVFVIGGSYGVDQTVMNRADFVWSLSKLVFPHQLLRILLLEQLYRTLSLRDGGKYHH